MRLFVVFTPLLMVGALCTPASISASPKVPLTVATACTAPLTLVLRPGPIPGGVSLQNQAPARDIPPNPVITRLPLYPAATPSTGRIPLYNAQTLPPGYRKIALAEFALPAGLSAAMDWYSGAMRACGLVNNGTASFPGHGGPRFTALVFVSRDGLHYVLLTFRPVSPRLTLVRYLVQALDLPPRSGSPPGRPTIVPRP